MSWFKQAIDSLKPDKQNKNESEIALNLIKEQIDTLKQKQQLELDSLIAKFAEAQTNAGQTTVQSAGATKKPIQTPKVVINESINEEGPSNTPLIRREFKISGQIGEPGQRDKLTFVSLTHQIDSGLKGNYKESEIVDAVIRAISLHSSLRSYVETLNDLSLPKLRKILRVHYREKSASELYQHLATIFQQPKETAQQFLLRALDLRNKVGFASKESECEVQYDEPLIQKTFMKSFETGLRDDILAANLRPILRTSGLTDEELMKHVNELASHQAERQNKLACERRLANPNSPYVMTEVYEVESENGGRKNRVLHRNVLLPCDYLPVENSSTHTERPAPPTTRRIRKPTPRCPASQNDDISSDDESDQDLVTVVPLRNPTSPRTTPDTLSENEENAILPEANDVLPEANEVPPEGNEVQGERHNEQVENRNVRNGDQVNGEQHDDNLNPPPEIYRTQRPRRIRHPPDRLTYYGPGEAMQMGLFQISVPSPETAWQPPPLPNLSYPFLPPAFPYFPPISRSPVPLSAHPYPLPSPHHLIPAHPYPYPIPSTDHLIPVMPQPVMPQPVMPVRYCGEIIIKNCRNFYF